MFSMHDVMVAGEDRFGRGRVGITEPRGESHERGNWQVIGTFQPQHESNPGHGVDEPISAKVTTPDIRAVHDQQTARIGRVDAHPEVLGREVEYTR